MNDSARHPLSNTVRLFLMATLAIALSLGTGLTAQAAPSPLPVDLGAAAHFVILSKSGITNVPTSDIKGDLGVSPIAAPAITGFSLILDSSGQFSRSSQVTGKIYASNYASPTPANLTTAVSNMQTAYVDAAGRAPDYVELYGGNLSGRTLLPGVYKWSTGVLVNTAVTLAGPADAVWIFEIAQNLTLASGARVVLSGGAQARNIFWQVGGGVGVNIGTTAHMEGTILAAKAIHLLTGASMTGRTLAQTAVTLQKNILVIPPSTTTATQDFYSNPAYDGWVLESAENSNVGGTMNSAGTTFALGDNAANKQYRAVVHFNTGSLPDTAVISSARLLIVRQGLVGTNPFSTLGALQADIRRPFFGTIAALQLGDFQAPASASSVAAFGSPTPGYYTAFLNAAGRSLVNRTGTTQFRLRFVIGDNNNHIADYLQIYSGEATSLLRPRLTVTYSY